MLRTQGLTKSFGGLMTTNNVNLEIEKGELSSIIGPNGAGKTTLFNLLTGHLRPDSGRVIFKDKDITGLPPHKICRLGVGRSFQHINIFPKLTVFDNVQAAVLARRGKCINIFSPSKNMYREETIRLLETVELDDERDLPGELLSYGDQKRLEIGIALALRPSLLLLDEPTAGMSPEETAGIAVLIESVVQQQGLTALFVEHDMSVVFGISQKIRVLHLGQIIAIGTPEEISADVQVQRIYLGEE
ncbi:MAG: ABC transporter ATP-binding protein [Deltaproteobacteria bacterium]|nr:ABC transporter ATP-binding protein [Deltaproteobacteria bacterium]MBW2343392.1 ABC transporter ATP-binding protein [Deltaproteobacteria bacterium]